MSYKPYHLIAALLFICLTMASSCSSTSPTTSSSPKLSSSASLPSQPPPSASGPLSSTNPFHLPDSLPPLPPSEIDLPVKIYAASLLRMADSTIPREFTSEGWPAWFKASCEFRYKYRFVRSAFTIGCVNNQLTLQWQGSYQVAGGKCLCTMNKPISPWASGSCGFDNEPLRKVDITLGSHINFLPGYRINTQTRLQQLKSRDKCIVSILSTDITQQVADSIRASISSFCATFDKTLADLNFSSYAAQAVTQARQPTQLGHYGYLRLNPASIRIGQLNYAKDTFSISAGLSCRPDLSSDSNQHAIDPPLPPLIPGNNQDGLTLYVPLHYSYAFISRLLHDTLYNKSFVLKGRTVILKDIDIHGIGNHQVEIRIDFAGSKKGRVYLRGTPLLDTARQTLSVPDIAYSLESRDLILKMAKVILRNKIRQTLRGNTYLDLAALIKTNLPAIDSQLNRQLSPGIYTRGHMEEIKMIGLLAGDSAVQVQLYMRGNLDVIHAGQFTFNNQPTGRKSIGNAR